MTNVAERNGLLQRTLGLLILKAVALGPRHGLGIARRITQITQAAFEVGPGSLFPALHRFGGEGMAWQQLGLEQNNRKAKFYRLTQAGQRQLETEVRQWERIALAITRAIEAKS